MIVLVGSADVDLALLQSYLDRASKVIAVDGGLNHLEKLGAKAHLILGDFDSYEGQMPEGAMVYPSEKNFSDMEAALEHVGDEETYIFGATGGRLDHFLSVLELIRGRENIQLVDGQNRLFYRRGSFKLPEQEGYFSLFPQEAIEISITGAKYDLENEKVLPQSSLLLSNTWINNVKINLSKGWVLVVLSQDK